MRKVSAREANQNFSRLLAEAEAGETIVITKRGSEVAELVPASTRAQRRSLQEQAERRARIDELVAWLKEGVEFTEPAEFKREEIYDR
ncbi:type II toxin-antitoxin system Phd/YefM family antitoxin [Geminicoccus roseus]|uniref:type II toxin-antitoxin system Phd/YefM family antitoxin n=1 Tax=Geminicoccus roseus TaxID=404900 RepID=UPI00041139AE|nr:type II toxin-antitoxin system prevent-host-death family antitoxin [Geminicoccus roseus]